LPFHPDAGIHISNLILEHHQSSSDRFLQQLLQNSRVVYGIICRKYYFGIICRKQLKLPTLTDPEKLGLAPIGRFASHERQVTYAGIGKVSRIPRKASMELRDRPLRQISPQRLRQIANSSQNNRLDIRLGAKKGVDKEIDVLVALNRGREGVKERLKRTPIPIHYL
jgi:hypothetical protein